MVNAGMGEILSIIFSGAVLIFGFDKIIATVFQGAPLSAEMLQPAIPFIVYFFIGMVATTACSPSLEGKNYWIVQSLPIEKKTLYKGKMLFNMYLTVPFMELSVLLLCIAAKAPVLNTVLYMLLGFALCCFSTAWGCVCGARHIKLEWENEVEVIKQGSAVAIYMLPNMFIVMGLCVLVVFLGTKIEHSIITAAFIAITSLLAFLSYRRVMKLAKK
jgi:ABC-2 type transport system permease protein